MTIIDRLGGRKAAISFSGQFVLLAGYVFCVKAGGDSATFLTFAGAICGLAGVGFGANAYVHKVQKDEKVAQVKADSAENVATTKAEVDKAVAETNAK